MTHEGEIRRIDGEIASEFYRTLDVKGFEQAMHVLDHFIHLDPEQPLVLTLHDNGVIDLDLLTKPIPYTTIRRLLGY